MNIDLGSSHSESPGSEILDLKGKLSKLAQRAHLFPTTRLLPLPLVQRAAVGQHFHGDTLLVLGYDASKRQKRHNSGLKHNVFNKVRIRGQKV